MITVKDLKWLSLAEHGAKTFSTCSKRQCFAIILNKYGNCVGTGYNGGPSKTKHCTDGGCQRALDNSPSGTNYDNCFHGDTEFLTRNGVRTLASTVNSDVEVLTSKGWKSARVEPFGRQELMSVVLRRYSDRRTILATRNHRWFTYDSHRVRHTTTTEQLAIGHVLASAYARTGSYEPCSDARLAGLVFGDGSRSATQLGSGSFIHMCAGKNEQLNYLWGDRPFSLSDGDRIYRNLPRKWKDLPDLGESFGYLYGWLQGYFAADGTVSHSNPVLYSSIRANLEAVQEICYILGIPTLHIKSTQRLGYGSNATELFRLPFPTGALDPSFFLLDHHRESVSDRIRKRDLPRWTVESVESAGFDETYCVVEPELNEFTLTDNILTGNCIAIHAEANALLHSTAELHGGILYVNYPPCFGCIKLIVNSGIQKVVCIEDDSFADFPRTRDLARTWGLNIQVATREDVDGVHERSNSPVGPVRRRR